MRKVTVIILLLLMSSGLNAYTTKEGLKVDYENGYRAGSTAYIFWNTANVFKKGNASSEIIATLTLGTPVTVDPMMEGETDYTKLTYYEQKGYKGPWYKVTWVDAEGVTASGYTWGGNLSKAAISFNIDNNNKPELIMMGITGAERDDEDGFTKNARVKLVKDGRTISFTDFDAPHTSADDPGGKQFLFSAGMSITNPRGFTPPFLLLRVRFFDVSEEQNSGDAYFIIKDGKVAYAFTMEEQCRDGVCIKHDITYPSVIPGRPGSKPNHLVIVEKSAGGQKTYDYLWKEGKLTLQGQ
ncbi:MAG: hypothetical protein LLG37_06055 [Spirochaetia bacterium]|nr:hypothetical protein [Spirochaetia bacterium]